MPISNCTEYFNPAYDQRQRIIQVGSPRQKIDERMQLKPTLANLIYKPAAQDYLMIKVSVNRSAFSPN